MIGVDNIQCLNQTISNQSRALNCQELMNDHSTIPPWEITDEPPAPVIVLGMHNSGTTLLARIMHRRGLFLQCNAGMSESYFFSHFIANRVVLGGEEAAWSRIPIISVEEVLARRNEVEQLIQKHWRLDYIQWGYDGVGPWGFKDPRSCILLPLYLQIFPEAKLLAIRRDIDDIAASLSHRFKPGIGVLNDADHWRRLTQSYWDRVDEFGKAHANYFEINYEDLCTEPEQTVAAVYEYLQLPLDAETIRYATRTASTSSIGTREWSEGRWRWEARKRRWKQAVAPLYDLVRGKET